MRKLIRLLVLVLLAPLICSFALEAWLFLVSNVKFEHIKWFALGFLLYIIIYPFMAQKRKEVFEDFEHELAHAVVGFVFLKGTRKFIVNPRPQPIDSTTEEGSRVAFDPPVEPNFLIALAPYYLPTFTVLLLMIEPIVFYPIHEVIDFLIGFTLALHCVSLLKNFRLIQTDITRVGVIFSFVVTCILNTVILVITLCVVSSDYASILRYFESSLARTMESYEMVYQKLKMLSEFTSISGETSRLWRIAV